MEKTVDYYMGLPYTVELDFGWAKYQASVKELPMCRVSVKASESMGELWRLLKEEQRKRIEELLELGYEVPESPSATTDPFWADFEKHNPGYEHEEVMSMLYNILL